MERLKAWAGAMQRDVLALYLAGRDSRVPWYAKVLALATAAYALSPIDLIPDFIPVLGYLDDLIIVPLGILLAVRLVPAEVMQELRLQAQQRMQSGRPKSFVAAAAIILIWLVSGGVFVWLMMR